MRKWKEGDIVVFKERRRTSRLWESSVMVVKSVVECKMVNCRPLQEKLGTPDKCPKIILRLVPAKHQKRPPLALGFCPFRVNKVKTPRTSLGVAGFIFNGA